MKNLTYRNLMRGIKIIQAKGYDFDEANKIARNLFEQTGVWTFEQLAKRVLTKAEFEAMYA